MNYLAHGWRYVDDPYFLAGTALPDWLAVLDRSVRVRSRTAEPFLADPDPQVARLAAGVVQHHRDDAWFHGHPAFLELWWQLADRTRRALPPDEGFRPSFVGHVAVELLLDAALADARPHTLAAYYAAIDALDAAAVQRGVNRLAPRPVARLAELIPLFSRERFLPDYLDDARLCYRLNQVLARAGLPRLPAEFTTVLAETRRLVYARADELLTPPAARS